MLKGIRLALFDLDGTLRLNRPSYAQLFDEYVAGLDGALNTAENRRRAMRWEHHYWAGSPDQLADRDTFGEDEVGFWTNYNRRRMIVFGIHPERAAALATPVYQAMKAYAPVELLAEDAIPTLEELRLRGLKVGLVSNRQNPVDELLVSLGLEQQLDFSVISGEVNSWKPDPGIFAHALLRAGVAAEQAFYVGDNYYADVVGARRAGLHPVLLDPLRIFDEPGCPVLSNLAQVLSLLES